ncbi:retinol dehydrogenase 7-like [Protopterus annectens]|uniref:retinol dehydrogenase 7-like n=1 Tax=Protopterus annectens TaxID=7888 RepID=UPI001CFA86FF|nr:retinol dehydrogenase 7-like [Protopterus annectens]XP_043939658.1 retinol dehydrogenase 7-like [Protopterus annectens]XP_043939659.1 retinol dehydrogenase 7-like [Protopterus annectens]XP_043939660.1 retinol dehydrogenase 7-like [Protopterus annectens]
MWLYLTAFIILWALVWFFRDRLTISNVKDKYIFITGCDTGFGNLHARRLDKKGFRVLAACLTQKGADDLQRSSSSRLKTTILDVSSSESIKKAVTWVQAEVGENGLWGLVNNAGRAIPIGPTEWMQIEDFERVLAVNMTGLIEVTLNFLPVVKKAKGRIVNTASVLGRIAANGGAYCLSKAGVESFSDSLRRDVHHFGIRIAIIEPGFFKTAVTSLEPIERDLQQRWDKLDAETRDSYGRKYFNSYLKVQRFCMNLLCSTDISKVTDCVEHALTARYPRTRYSPGWDAKFLWIPMSYMPTIVSDTALALLLPKPTHSY